MRKYDLTSFWNIVIIMLSFSVFVTLLILVTTNNSKLNLLDNQISNFFANNRVRFFDYIFVIISYLGQTKLIALFCAILLILPNRKKLGLPVTILTVASALINLIIKFSVMRARPEGYFLTQSTFFYTMPTSYSFPSGHSQTANLFYLSLTFFSLKYFRKNISKILLTIFVTLFCFLMSFGRIYLGVHFFSDVWAGVSLMIFILSLAFFIFRKSYNSVLNIYEL